MQPTCRQVPPSLPFSTSATDRPSCGRAQGAGVAAAARPEDHHVEVCPPPVPSGPGSSAARSPPRSPVEPSLHQTRVLSTPGPCASVPLTRASVGVREFQRNLSPARHTGPMGWMDRLRRGGAHADAASGSLGRRHDGARLRRRRRAAPARVRHHPPRRRGVRRAAHRGQRRHDDAGRARRRVDPPPGARRWSGRTGSPTSTASRRTTRPWSATRPGCGSTTAARSSPASAETVTGGGVDALLADACAPLRRARRPGRPAARRSSGRCTARASRAYGGPGRSTADTPFHAGSIAKALAALVVLDAAARGEVALDVPCGQQSSAAWDDTPLDLMAQTTGRPNELPGARRGPRRPSSPASARCRGCTRPGRFSYCNAGWSVLDLLLRERSGRRLRGAGRRARARRRPRFGTPARRRAGHVVRPGGAPRPGAARPTPPAASAAGVALVGHRRRAARLRRAAPARRRRPVRRRRLVAQMQQPHARRARVDGRPTRGAWAGRCGSAATTRRTAGRASPAATAPTCAASPSRTPRSSCWPTPPGRCSARPGGSALFDELLPALLEVLDVPPLPDGRLRPAAAGRGAGRRLRSARGHGRSGRRRRARRRRLRPARAAGALPLRRRHASRSPAARPGRCRSPSTPTCSTPARSRCPASLVRSGAASTPSVGTCHRQWAVRRSTCRPLHCAVTDLPATAQDRPLDGENCLLDGEKVPTRAGERPNRRRGRRRARPGSASRSRSRPRHVAERAASVERGAGDVEVHPAGGRRRTPAGTPRRRARRRRGAMLCCIRSATLL